MSLPPRPAPSPYALDHGITDLVRAGSVRPSLPDFRHARHEMPSANGFASALDALWGRTSDERLLERVRPQVADPTMLAQGRFGSAVRAVSTVLRGAASEARNPADAAALRRCERQVAELRDLRDEAAGNYAALLQG